MATEYTPGTQNGQFGSGGGGGGAVDSVNGETGTVVLDAADVGAAGTSANTYTGTQRITNTEPRYIFEDSDGGVDQKIWDIDVNGGVISLRSRTDADGAGVDAFTLTRGTGTAVAGAAFAAPVQINSTEPRLILNETDGGTNSKIWDIDVQGSVMSMRTRSDVDGAGVTFLSVTRNAASTALTTMVIGANGVSYTYLGGNHSYNGSGFFNGGIVAATGTAPVLRVRASGAGTDQKQWAMVVNGTTLTLQTQTDGDVTGSNILSVVRGATTAVASIAIGNGTDNPAVTFPSTANSTFFSRLSALTFEPSSATVSGIGSAINRPAANALGFVTNATLRASFDSTGLLTTLFGRSKAVRVITAAGAIALTGADHIVVVNKTVGAASAVSLPAGVTGQEFVIKDGKGDAVTNAITITPAAGTIDGAATFVINTTRGAATLIYSGTEWIVVAVR